MEIPVQPGLKILIVEDDPHISELLEHNLKEQGYNCFTCRDGHAALNRLKLELPDLLILDRVLPGRDGIYILRKLRELSDTPVLMLTSLKSEENKLEGFAAGTDDYLAKPFAIMELLARVRALLKRSGKTTPTGCITIGNLKIDPSSRRAWAANVALDLSPLEFKVLSCLCLNQGQILSRDDLLLQAWGMDYEGYNRAVDTLIKRLRKKLAAPGMPDIKTARGHGYFFEVNDD
jgi:DNA-binding response OmpR family regulator